MILRFVLLNEPDFPTPSKCISVIQFKGLDQFCFQSVKELKDREISQAWQVAVERAQTPQVAAGRVSR